MMVKHSYASNDPSIISIFRATMKNILLTFKEIIEYVYIIKEWLIGHRVLQILELKSDKTILSIKNSDIILIWYML